MRFHFLFFLFGMALCSMLSCGPSTADRLAEKARKDSLATAEKAALQAREAEEAEKRRPRTKADIRIEKALKYDQHTLDDTYPYQDTTRSFQWEKIKEQLARVENIQRHQGPYGVLQNYKNLNGEAPLVSHFSRNAYKRVVDSLGTERYQSTPLFLPGQSEKPVIYGRDGWLVALESPDSLAMQSVTLLSFEGKYEVPKKYVKRLEGQPTFRHVVAVDVTHQNITHLEQIDGTWMIRSMNPATTGQHKPPYAQETPLGIFVMQEKKQKMYFLKDGSRTEIAGFAPWASRFTNGGYIHGIPVNYPSQKIIEFSWSLGTIPRSHMCVRVASSHAQWIYDQATAWDALVVVID
jgi:hypothetical protein